MVMSTFVYYYGSSSLLVVGTWHPPQSSSCCIGTVDDDTDGDMTRLNALLREYFSDEELLLESLEVLRHFVDWTVLVAVC